MFQRTIPVAVAICLAVCWAGTSLASKVYIDIDSPGYQPMPIALVVVPPSGALERCWDPQWEKLFVDVLKQDMEISGFFRVIPSDLYLADAGRLSLYPATIDFRAWSLIGADALLLLQIYCQGDSIICEAQLLDVLTGKLLTWKRYKSAGSGIRRAAHKFANEVEKELTGRLGAYDTRIAFISSAGANKELYVMDCDGHNPRQVTRLKSLALSPAWSPDGASMAFTSYWKGSPQIYLIDLHAPNRTTPLLPGFAPLCSGAAWSPDGKRIAFSAFRDGKNEIYCMAPNPGKKPEQITKGWSIDVSPSWSPDGKQIVFVSSRAGNPDLYVMRGNGGDVRRLTFEGNYNADPDWSPLGDWIVYVSRVNGRFQIFRIRPDGTQRTPVTMESGNHLNPSWSPNGRLIAFSSNREGSYDIYLIRMDGTGLRKLSRGPKDETEPAWSPRVDD